MHKISLLIIALILFLGCSGPSPSDPIESAPSCRQLANNIRNTINSGNRAEQLNYLNTAILENDSCQELLVCKAEWGNLDFELSHELFREDSLDRQELISRVNLWTEFYNTPQTFQNRRHGGLFQMEIAKYWNQLGNKERTCQAYWSAIELGWKSKEDPLKLLCDE